MNWVLLISIAVHLTALVWSVESLRRLRDWRLAFLSLMLALMVLHRGLTLPRLQSASMSQQWADVPVLAISVMSLLAVYFLGKLLDELERSRKSDKRANEELSERERRLQAIIETEPECVKLLGPSGTLLQINPAGLRMVEADSPDQVVGRSILEVVLPEYQPAYTELLKRVLRGGTETLEFEIQGLRGTRRWLETHATPYRDAAGQITSLLGITRDITARKRVEETLHTSEQRFRALIEHSFDAIALVSQDGALIYGSPAVTRITGRSADEWFGQGAFERIHPDDLQLARDIWAKLLENPAQTQQSQFRYLHKNESWISLEITATNLLSQPAVQAIVVNYRDVTERVRAEKLAEMHRAELQLIFDSVPALIFYKDLRGCLARVNDAFAKQIGLPKDRIKGQTAAELGSPYADQYLVQELQVVSTGQPVRNIIEKMHTARGDRWMQTDKIPHCDTDGRIIGIVGFSVDITDNKRAVEALRASEERFSKVFHKSPESIALVSLFDGRLIEVNDQFVEFTGHRRDEALGRTTLELGLWENPAERDRFYQLLREPEGVHAFEAGLRTKSGERRDMLFSADLIELDGQACAITTGRDVTTQKQVEHALRESQSRLQMVMQASDVGLWDWNLLTNEAIFSTEYKRQLGYADEEFPNRFEEWESRLHPDDRPRTLAAVSDFHEGRRPDYDVEFRLRHKDGSWRWILARADTVRDAAGRLVRMMGCHVDITERKHAELMMLESQQALADIVNTVDGIVWEADAQTFQFSFISQQAEQILGYPVDRWLTEPTFWRDHLHPQDRDTAVDFCVNATRQGESHEFEYRMLSADGREVWLNDLVTVVLKDGAPVKLRGIMVDITEHKGAEAALVESEQRFRELYESSRDAIFVEDSSGHVLDVNSAACRLHGLTRDQLLSKNVRDLVPEEQWEGIDRNFSKLLCGELTQTEGFSLRADGTVVPVELSVSRIVYSGQPSLLLHVRDITERKRAETALREREQQLRLFVEHSPAAIAMMDRDLRYLVASQRWLSDYRLGAEPIIGRRHYDLFPEIPERWKEIHRRCLAGAIEKCDEDAFLRADGATDWLRWEVRPWYTVHGEVGGLIMFSEVITERKLAETALRASEQRFATVFHSSPVGICVTRLADGTFLDMNDAFSRIVGHTREEMIGRTSLALNYWVDPEDRAKVVHALQATGSVRNWEMSFLRRDGTVRDSLRSLERITLDGEDCILTILEDITERKHIEAALRESQTMLELVLDSIPQGVFWKDRSSVYLGANRVVRQALGFDTPESIIGKTDFDTSSLTRDQAEFFVGTDRDVMNSDQPQFGIKETMTLVDGSTIWLETNKQPMHASSGRVVGLLGTWQDITARKRADDELRASRERLQVLSRQLLNAQEAERRHIARELHDQIGQSLTAIKLNLKMLQPSVPETSTLTILHETIAVVDQTLEQVRTLSLELRPSMLDDLGLAAALRWYLDRQAQRAGFSVQFASELSGSDVSKEIETTCFRVAQEIVTNIARHAHSRNVRVELRRLETELELFIQDDGVGFDLTAAREQAPHETSLGLLGMQERLLIVGGRLDIQTAPSRGTEVRVRFPLMPTAAGSETEMPHAGEGGTF